MNLFVGEVSDARLAIAYVLEGEERRVERGAAHVPLDLQLLDEHLERHVLMSEGLDARLADAPQQARERFARVDAHPEGQCVDEVAEERLHLRATAAPNGRPHDDVGLSGQPEEVHVERREQHHVERRAASLSEVGEARHEIAGEHEGLRGSGERHARGTRRVRREFEQRQLTGELLEPEARLPLELRSGEPCLLPRGVVAVRDPEWGQRRRLASRERRIQTIELVEEHVERPPVPHRVVRHEEQHALARAQEKERRPDERPLHEIERLGGRVVQSREKLFLPVRRPLPAEVDRYEIELQLRSDRLTELSVAPAERRAEGGVACHNRVEGAGEGGLIQPPVEAEARGQVVDRRPRVHLLHEPESLLHRRERDALPGAQPRDGVGTGALPASLVERPGEGPDGGPLEEAPHRQLHLCLAGDLGHDLGRQERMASQLEEVVGDRDALQPEDPLPDPLDEPLALRLRDGLRRPIGRRGCDRGRQLLPVDLAVGRERQRCHLDEVLRHHVVGQRDLQVRPEGGRLRHGSLRHDIGHEPLVPWTILPHEDHGTANLGMATEHSLDLTELDAIPAELDLPIAPTEAFGGSVGEDPREVAGPVEVSRAEGVGDEALLRELGPAQIAEGHAGTRDA